VKHFSWILLLLIGLSLACRLPIPSRSASPTSVESQTASLATPTTLWEVTSTPTLSQQEPAFDAPENQTDPLAKANEAVFIGDWQAALSAYQSVLAGTTDPGIQAAAQLGLGKVYFLSGDDYNAERNLQILLELQPQASYSAEADYYLALIHTNQNLPLEAAQAYQAYLDINPGVIDTYIHEARADALLAGDDYPGAMQAYQAALNSPRLTPNLDLEIKLAQSYDLVGDTDTAQVMYADIYQRSDVDYQKAKVDLLLGRLYANLGQPEQAYATWLEAVNNYPTTYDAYQSLVELVNAGYPVDELQRGIIDFHAGEYGVALAAFDRYLAGVPTDPASAYYYRGLSQRAIEDIPSALAAWDVVIQGYPDSSVVDQAYEQKAYTQWAYLEQYPEASQALLDFVSLYPVHARAAEFLFDAARIAERGADLPFASQLWQRVVSDYPTSSYAYESAFQAGIADMRSSNFISAQTQFIQAQQLAANPIEQSRALFWSAKCYQALGDNNAAFSTFRQTSQIDPTGYYSERALDLVEGRLPFVPPQVFDLGFDPVAERQAAQNWLRTTFALPEEEDFSHQAALMQDDRLRRGLELWKLGQSAGAIAEIENLRLALQGDPLNSYYLINILLEHRIYRPAILASRQILDLAGMDDAATLDAPMYFNRIRFGNYYASLVIPASQEFNLHPLLIWSIIRQESLFDPSIRSTAGAVGLMQITQATGQDIANRLGWPPGYTTQDLLRPQVSIRLGMDYLDDQLSYLNGDLYAALAGYNAGPGNAAVWQSLAPEDKDLFVEVIRFSEPQRYIKGIYENFSIYRKLYERSP